MKLMTLALIISHMYSIGFSMGYAIYDKKLYVGAGDFLKTSHINVSEEEGKKIKNYPSSEG